MSVSNFLRSWIESFFQKLLLPVVVSWFPIHAALSMMVMVVANPFCADLSELLSCLSVVHSELESYHSPTELESKIKFCQSSGRCTMKEAVFLSKFPGEPPNIRLALWNTSGIGRGELSICRKFDTR